jgi:4-hydroxyphenylpyruvate dioxygenase-like putative hemolysin
MEVLSLDRVMIAVPKVQDAQDQFSDLLRIHFDEPSESTIETTAGIQRSRISYGYPGVELIAPTQEDSGLARYLDAYGPGLFGVVFRVADIAASKEYLANHAVRPIAEHESDASRELHYHPNDFSGVYMIFTEYTHPGFAT